MTCRSVQRMMRSMNEQISKWQLFRESFDEIQNERIELRLQLGKLDAEFLQHYEAIYD